MISDKKKKRIFIVIGIILLILIVAIVIVVGKQGNISEENDVLSRGFVEESNAEVIMPAMEDKVAEGMFECTMTTKWHFKNGTSASHNAYVANSENNQYTFYFDVYLDDTNEVVYSSPLVPVGKAIQGIKLEKDLDAGQYPMRVQYTMVDEEYNEVSSAGFMITVTIQE